MLYDCDLRCTSYYLSILNGIIDFSLLEIYKHTHFLAWISNSGAAGSDACVHDVYIYLYPPNCQILYQMKLASGW